MGISNTKYSAVKKEDEDEYTKAVNINQELYRKYHGAIEYRFHIELKVFVYYAKYILNNEDKYLPIGHYYHLDDAINALKKAHRKYYDFLIDLLTPEELKSDPDIVL